MSEGPDRADRDRAHPTDAADEAGGRPDDATGEVDPGESARHRPGEPDPQDAESAASAALARARRNAGERGFRPGMTPRRRRRPTGTQFSGTDPGARDPVTIGAQVEQLLAREGWTADVTVGSVIGRWPQIVGPRIADHVRPVSFEQGVLVVQADSSAWATNLRLVQSDLLGTLAEAAGADTVTELRILGPAAPSWSRGPRRATDGRGPRDTYG